MKMRKILVFVLLLAGVTAFGQNSKVENNKKAKVTSIYDLIRMQPGVYVSESDNKIYIRGIGTNSSATQPLYIVDDMRTDENHVSHLTPEEVWSVEVIKDGTASFYGGMESANGVILIETNGYHQIKEQRAAEEKAAKLARRKAKKQK